MRHPPAVNLQYFLCIITQFKDCYKVIQPALQCDRFDTAVRFIYAVG